MSAALDFSHYPFDPDSLPAGWVVTSVGAASIDIKSGFASGAHNSDGHGVPHLRPMNIGPEGEIDMSDLRFVDAEGGPRLAPGDVLFNNTNSPAWVGKTALVTQEAPVAFSNHMTRLRMAEGVVPRFAALQLQYLCTSGYFRHRCKKHVNQASISATTLAETVPFILPPTAAQHRIVAKLDELLASSRAARSALDAVPALLEQYKQSVLDAAFAGELKGSSTGTRHWTRAPLEQLVTDGRKIAYGVLKPGDHVPNGVRLLKSGQVRDGYLDLSDDFRISEALAAQYWRTRLHGGEVLLNLVGASIGRSAVAPAGLAGANVSRAIAVIPVNDGLAEWVQLALQGPAGQRLMRAATGGSAQPVLNLGEVRQIEIPVPPPSERAAVLQAVREAFGTASRVLGRYQTAMQEQSRLESSFVAKAFRGGLVPQDSADEPASVLLERGRAPVATTARRRGRAGTGM